MALDENGLANALLAAFEDGETRNESAKEDMAKAFAKALKDFVMSGEIPIGLAVNTSGGSGATTQPGKII